MFWFISFTMAAENDIVCTDHYQPVCAKIQIQCIMAPCNPVYETYWNACEATRNWLATIVHEGECTWNEANQAIQDVVIKNTALNKIQNSGKLPRAWYIALVKAIQLIQNDPQGVGFPTGFNSYRVVDIFSQINIELTTLILEKDKQIITEYLAKNSTLLAGVVFSAKDVTINSEALDQRGNSSYGVSTPGVWPTRIVYDWRTIYSFSEKWWIISLFANTTNLTFSLPIPKSWEWKYIVTLNKSDLAYISFDYLWKEYNSRLFALHIFPHHRWLMQVQEWLMNLSRVSSNFGYTIASSLAMDNPYEGAEQLEYSQMEAQGRTSLKWFYWKSK